MEKSDMGEEKKYKKAFELLKEGKNPDGTPLNVAEATQKAFEGACKYSEELRIGQARTAEQLANKRFRG